jgi:RNA polymerase sigma-70 factor (ECF subfamily)
LRTKWPLTSSNTRPKSDKVIRFPCAIVYLAGRKETNPVFLAVLTSRQSDDASSDAALVQLLLRKDMAAFEQLYDRHSRIVYGLVLRILQQASTAEEVVQDVFLLLWRNAGQYQTLRGPFVPWLLTLARNRALDHLRLKSERQRRREDQTDVLPQIAQAPQYEKELDEKRRAEVVRSLMGSLSAPQKKAIEMAYFEGLSHSEIAAALQEPLGTVKSWIRNGLLRLKEGLQAAQ